MSSLFSLYNTNAERDKMRVLKNQINGLKKSSDNLINEIASGKSKIAKEDLRAKLNDVVERRKILTSELEQLTANIVTFTEDDRRSLCEEIAKMMYTGESLEIKKYLKETIAEIKVSNTDVEVTLNIA